MATIEAEGFLFRKALDRPPSLIIVIGIWILFMPAGVASALLAIYLILNQQGLANFVFFWAFVAVSYIAFVILYRITKNFVTRRSEEFPRNRSES